MKQCRLRSITTAQIGSRIIHVFVENVRRTNLRFRNIRRNVDWYKSWTQWSYDPSGSICWIGCDKTMNTIERNVTPMLTYTTLLVRDRIVFALPITNTKLPNTSNVKMPCLKYCRGGNKQSGQGNGYSSHDPSKTGHEKVIQVQLWIDTYTRI